MSRRMKASGLALGLLASCATNTVDLLPDDAAAAQDALLAEDATARADAEADDRTGADGSSIDAMNVDASASCACRFVGCTIDAECLRAMGAGSTCQGGACNGSAGSCRSAGDCRQGFECRADASSSALCP